jgi:hypothetical protein
MQYRKVKQVLSGGGGGYKERVEKGEYSGNMYSYMKIEK